MKNVKIKLLLFVTLLMISSCLFSQAQKSVTEKFNVTGMTCSACSAHVEKSVKKLNGVKSVNVNLLQNNMHVDFDETDVSVDDIINAVVSGGYGASVAGKKQEKKDNKIDNEISNMKFRLIVSLVCLVPLM